MVRYRVDALGVGCEGDFCEVEIRGGGGGGELEAASVQVEENDVE